MWSQNWPGSDANGDVIAYVIDDPNARFVVQTSGSAFQITGTPGNWWTVFALVPDWYLAKVPARRPT